MDTNGQQKIQAKSQVQDKIVELEQHLNHLKKSQDLLLDFAGNLIGELKHLEQKQATLIKSNAAVEHPVQKPANNTFAIPSHAIMFTLLAMFAGKPEKVPKRILEKPANERTPEEKKIAEEFLNSIISKEVTSDYLDTGQEVIDEKHFALICDNPKVQAKAEISKVITSQNIHFQEEALAVYIKRTFGAEGLRHLLGFLIALDQNGRNGCFDWSVNDHLERLGYQKKQSGVFKTEVKRTATEIVKILTSLFITTTRKDGKGKEEIRADRLFSVDGFRIEMFQKEVIGEILTLRATNFWYQNAFNPEDGKCPKYSKMLQKIVQEDHQQHWLTIYLAPLLSIFWRMTPEPQKLKVKKLMEWCDLDLQDHHRTHYLNELQEELNYMKSVGYIGDWQHNGETQQLLDCKNCLDCVITLTPPRWFQQEISLLQEKKTSIANQLANNLTSGQKGTALTKEQFLAILEKSGLSVQTFSEKLGISKRMVLYIKQGKRKPTRNISEEIKTLFGHLAN